MPVWDRLRFIEENYEKISNDENSFLMVKIIIALIISYPVAKLSIWLVIFLWGVVIFLWEWGFEPLIQALNNSEN
jgi:hypothetical protein